MYTNIHKYIHIQIQIYKITNMPKKMDAVVRHEPGDVTEGRVWWRRLPQQHKYTNIQIFVYIQLQIYIYKYTNIGIQI